MRYSYKNAVIKTGQMHERADSMKLNEYSYMNSSCKTVKIESPSCCLKVQTCITLFCLRNTLIHANIMTEALSLMNL